MFSELQKEREDKRAFEEIVAENSHNMAKHIQSQIQEAEKSNKKNPKKSTPRHITIKLLKTKNKEKILQAARGFSLKVGRES